MSNNQHIVQVEATNNVSGTSENVTSAPKTKGRWRLRASKGAEQNGVNEIQESQNGVHHKVEISTERSDLLGEVILTGRLAPDKKKPRENVERVEVMAQLTTKEFVWASKSLNLEDTVAVSYSDGTRRFTVHSFPFTKTKWLCTKARRKRKDTHFLAPNPDEALKWVCAFASQRCFVNCSPHPLSSAKRQGSIIDARDSPPGFPATCQPGRVMLVVLNPRSGRGCARKIYDSKVEPILKMAGFKLNVVETTGPHHAQKLAATMDLSTCIDGIICVGGDGLVNEVLNGLLSREDAKQSKGIPIGIIPAGSDNSLIWTVMRIRDPASAAVAIVKGQLVSTDIFAVEWTKTGDLHMGLTVAYYGFMSDVLELSEKYQKKFGPLRYFVAGALKFFCLPKYECEVEYLPAGGDDRLEQADSKGFHTEFSKNFDEPSDNFDRKLDIEAGSRMASNGLPNHEAVLMALCRISGDHDLLTSNIDANNESSEYVRGLDTKSKRVPSMRVPVQAGTEEVLAVNRSVPGATSPSPRPRTRSKSRISGWSGLSSGNGSSRSSWDYSMVDCSGESYAVSGEDISKSIGKVWGAQEGGLDLKVTSEAEGPVSLKHGRQIPEEDKWVVKQGPFLGVMICNHQCKTVQCLESQVLAPTAEHDDRTLDLVIVRGVGRFQLLRFLILMQFGRHLSLPFVEYTKVQSVKLKPGNNSHKGCGIDGELLTLNGPISTALLPEQCQLIGFRHN